MYKYMTRGGTSQVTWHEVDMIKYHTLCTRVGYSRGTWEPGSQEIFRSHRKFWLEIPRFCRENVIYLKRPKLHKKTILSDKKNNSCDRKNTVCDT